MCQSKRGSGGEGKASSEKRASVHTERFGKRILCPCSSIAENPLADGDHSGVTHSIQWDGAQIGRGEERLAAAGQ